jgi:hypothetical protein
MLFQAVGSVDPHDSSRQNPHTFRIHTSHPHFRIQARDLLQHLWTGPISNAPVEIIQAGSRQLLGSYLALTWQLLGSCLAVAWQLYPFACARTFAGRQERRGPPRGRDQGAGDAAPARPHGRDAGPRESHVRHGRVLRPPAAARREHVRFIFILFVCVCMHTIVCSGHLLAMHRGPLDEIVADSSCIMFARCLTLKCLMFAGSRCSRATRPTARTTGAQVCAVGRAGVACSVVLCCRSRVLVCCWRHTHVARGARATTRSSRCVQ